MSGLGEFTMKTIRSFNQAMEFLIQVPVEWELNPGGAIRLVNRYVFENYAQCPLYGISMGHTGHGCYHDLPMAWSLRNHIMNLADAPSYRRSYPKDAAKLLQACGLQ